MRGGLLEAFEMVLEQGKMGTLPLLPLDTAVCLHAVPGDVAAIWDHERSRCASEGQWTVEGTWILQDIPEPLYE